MGMWEDEMPRGMSRDEFYAALLDTVGQYAVDFVFEAKTPSGVRPIGVAIADFRFKGNGLEPHVFWFPWAEPRQILESVVNFLRDFGKQFKILLYIEARDSRFWEHVHNYKVMKKGCKVTDAYGPGEDAMLYYTPGPF